MKLPLPQLRPAQAIGGSALGVGPKEKHAEMMVSPMAQATKRCLLTTATVSRSHRSSADNKPYSSMMNQLTPIRSDASARS